MSNNIYIPDITRSSGILNIAQRRVLLCGTFGSGKTYTSITTSPNPQIVDVDKGITDPRLVARNDPTYPVWDDKWRSEVIKKDVRANAVMEITKTFAKKLTHEQTLIYDSTTSIQDSVHDFLWKIAPIAKGSTEKDGFGYWETVKDWWNEFFTALSALECHVILTAHLSDRRSKENPAIITGWGPLIDGSTKNFIGRFFTDVIMQHAIDKKEGEKVNTTYKWQVKSDHMFTAKSRANIDGLYIPADFNYLLNLK
jgi:hypothetical protein